MRLYLKFLLILLITIGVDHWLFKPERDRTAQLDYMARRGEEYDYVMMRLAQRPAKTVADVEVYSEEYWRLKAAHALPATQPNRQKPMKHYETVIQITNDTGVVEATVFGRLQARGVHVQDTAHYNLVIDPKLAHHLKWSTAQEALIRFGKALAAEREREQAGAGATDYGPIMRLLTENDVPIVVQLDVHIDRETAMAQLFPPETPAQFCACYNPSGDNG